MVDATLSLVELDVHHRVIDYSSNAQIGERALILVLPLLVTNLVSTTLIAVKAWSVSLSSSVRLQLIVFGP